jgi:hypothetical protein
VAELGAVNLVGESIVALLSARRSLLAAEGRLGPVPPSQKIAHVPIAELIGNSPPSSGLSVSCYHIGRSDHPLGRMPEQDPSQGTGISLELSYLMASWSTTPSEEQSLLSWAMLELNRYAVLDRGQLVDGGKGTSWDRGESIQIVPEDADPDRLFRLWDGLKQKYRLSTLFKARIVRIGYRPARDSVPVAASRFSFAHGDPATEPAL